MGDSRSGERGLRFECTGCAECCRQRGAYAHVYVDDGEVEALAALLELPVPDFKRRFTFVDKDGWRQIVFREGACSFLDRDTGRCGVYEARPGQCRTFPFWPELVRRGRWTAEARRLCEGVGRGRLHRVGEVRQLLAQSREPERR